MAHEDIVFNGNNFVENLRLLLRAEISDINRTDLNIRNHMDTFNFPTKSATEFLSLFSDDNNPLEDWEHFESQWKAYSGDTSDGLFEGLRLDFLPFVGSTLATGPQFDREVINAFTHFLSTYPYEPINPADPDTTGIVGPFAFAATNFFTNWTRYMARTAEFNDSLTPPVGGVDLASYDKVYFAFFPDNSTTDFNIRLQQFYEEALLETGNQNPEAGFFIPSHHFDEWFEVLRDEYLRSSTLSALDIQTTVSTDATERILVIDRILRLLLEMLDVLQRVSATQAQRLNFLTIWQQAYTDLIVDVPQFAVGANPNNSAGNAVHSLSVDGPRERFFRNEVNPHMQAILERVRARRSAVQDEARQMQTTINQSQDAANQQTQLATSLIQQMATILAQIFR